MDKGLRIIALVVTLGATTTSFVNAGQTPVVQAPAATVTPAPTVTPSPIVTPTPVPSVKPTATPIPSPTPSVKTGKF